jgi:hypothetical protein
MTGTQSPEMSVLMTPPPAGACANVVVFNSATAVTPATSTHTTPVRFTLDIDPPESCLNRESISRAVAHKM